MRKFYAPIVPQGFLAEKILKIYALNLSEYLFSISTALSQFNLLGISPILVATKITHFYIN